MSGRDELAEAFRRMADVSRDVRLKSRDGWTDEEWVADAEAIMGHIDGSSSSLLNGHIAAMLRTIRTLKAKP